MTDLAFGRYENKNTCVHTLDARTKIFLLIISFVTIFLQFKVWSTTLIITGILFILIFVLMIISKTSIRSLFSSLKGLWFLILFLLIIYIFIPNSTYVNYAFSIGSLKIYWDAFYQCGYILIRLVMMISLTMILTSSTKPMDMTRGLEWGMSFLKPIHFPVHEIAMTISIALRFIPTILDETFRIMKAQESRGVDYSHGSLAKRFSGVVALIIPLFVSAIERSDELADAMEARGYNPQGKRTYLKKLKFGWSDLVATLIVLAIFGCVLGLFIVDQNTEGGFNIIELIFHVKPLF